MMFENMFNAYFFFFSEYLFMKEIKINQLFLNFKHFVKRSHLWAYSLKKCTLLYSYVFCLQKSSFIFWKPKSVVRKKV